MSANKIDWNQQWESFAPNFYDGKAHIDLSLHGTLLLAPGAGFGDFSHPTTRLMLELMTPLVRDQIVLDIGCGSGILTLASLMMGAKKSYGIDIDPQAIKHACQNSLINKLDKKAIFSKQLHKPKDSFIILMNMIFSEQQIAFHPKYRFKLIVTSGVLLEGRDRYLAWTNAMGWELMYEKKEEEWLGFVFKNLNATEYPC